MNWKFKTFKNAQVVSYYNQAINVDAPHPAAARLWEEYLYSADARTTGSRAARTRYCSTP